MELSSPQKTIWNLQKYYQDTAVANICGAIVYHSAKDNTLLRKAIGCFLHSQSVFRLAFSDDGEPLQSLADCRTLTEAVEWKQFASFDALDAYAETLAKTPVQPGTGRTFRFIVFEIEEKSGVLVWMNHILADAWSFGIMAEQVEKIYQELAGKRDKIYREPAVAGMYKSATAGMDKSAAAGMDKSAADQIDNLAVEGRDMYQITGDYLDFVKEEQQYRQSGRYEKDRSFWKKRYAVIPEKTVIRPFMQKQSSIAARRITKVLDGKLEGKIQACCEKYSVTPAVVMEAAIVIYLAKMNDWHTYVTIGLPVLNRVGKKQKQTVGMFASTLPLTIAAGQKMTVMELLKNIAAAHMEVFRHQRYPYEEIMRELRERKPEIESLYEVMFSYQRTGEKMSGDTRWYANGCAQVPFMLHVDRREGQACHTLTVDYQTAVFEDEREVHDILGRLEYILAQILDESAASKILQEISILPEQEKDRIVNIFNPHPMREVVQKNILQMFSEQVSQKPEAEALIFEEKRFSFAQLDALSDRMASFLIKRKTGQDTISGHWIVPVIAKKCWQVVVAMLGILKAGGAYLLLSEDYPVERIRTIVNLTGSRTGLTAGLKKGQTEALEKALIESVKKEKEALEETAKDAAKKTVEEIIEAGAIALFGMEDVLEKKKEPICEKSICEKPICEEPICDGSQLMTPEAAAYAVFTSGSTGVPKGILLPHRTVTNLVCWEEESGLLDDCRLILSQTTILFDVFTQEVFTALLTGRTLLLAGDEVKKDIPAFTRLVMQYRPDMMFATPSYYHLLSKETELTFPKVILAGEPFYLNERAKSRKTLYYNHYGPAETHVVTQAVFHGEAQCGLGKPIANTQIYILNRFGEIQPCGVAGELCVAGQGMALGYVRQTALTGQRFLKNPFATPENGHGSILYRTGDAARFEEDGSITFLGRMDTQVKLNGIRMEPEEIEKRMNEIEGVRMAAVVVQKNRLGKDYLAAYYLAEKKIGEKTFREFLAEKLPAYMVPHHYVRLGSFPMTASGKIDRKNMPSISMEKKEKAYAAPANALEKTLCHIMEEVLHRKLIGREDHFFELGGDSLSAIEFAAKCHHAGIELALQQIFDHPTIRELSQILKSAGDEPEQVHYEAAEFQKYKSLLSKNVPEDLPVQSLKSLGNVLLTGSTGFLGMHILYELLKTEKVKIYCLIRAGSMQEAKQRLKAAFTYYFEDVWSVEEEKRLIPVCGDITDSRLPEMCPADVDTVIHAAAIVKHYGVYEIFRRVNVEGTENIIRYSHKCHARLIHISTIGVSGNSFGESEAVKTIDENKLFDETMFYTGQSLENVYIRSKFEAEKRVFDAVLRGLDAKVIRVGNLTNSVRTMKFQSNYQENAFLTRIKAMIGLGAFPEYLLSLPLEFSPVDRTAAGIVLASRLVCDCQVFHVFNDKKINAGDFLAILDTMGIRIIVQDRETFNRSLAATLEDQQKKYIYEAFQNEVDSDGNVVYDRGIMVTNALTNRILEKQGFEWKKPEEAYIRKYVTQTVLFLNELVTY